MDFAIDYILIPLIKIGVIFGALSLVIAYLTFLERKVIAFMQVRLGPMRVGPYGLLQPIADGVKLMLKEDIVPSQADRWIFTLAPIITLIPAFIVFAVIPFGPSFTILGKEVALYVTDLNIGVLYVLSISSVGILGIILGGWASNSKYPLLGALRSAAQMVSYEVALGFSIMGVLMISGSLSLVDIVNGQKASGIWNVFLQPLGFILFFICGVAENNRAPFDLPEAESELVAGFHTEYSGFRFSLFFLAEYAAMIVISSMAVTFFWGGWLPPFPNLLGFIWDQLPPVLAALSGVFWFSLKVLIFLYMYLWFRASWPRYRYDQLMQVGWRYLMPIAIGNVIITAIVILLLERMGVIA
ncbi:MAG TPA: NADH-quinone oxidoreductase subunit NuoH [Terriglobia bacterium]|nr:NADH-quinone oxidoreductase subunit NuoH [Terriglobia bacterium]